MAKDPTLTSVLFAGLIVTFVTMILLLNYSNFVVDNNAIIEEPYYSIFENISNSYDSFSDTGFTIKDKGLVTGILDFGKSFATGTVNVFVTGLQAMETFFDMIPIWKNIMNAISFGIPGIGALLTLLMLMISIYIAMRYIKSASNKTELP
jgi:hypothetical protein